MAMAHSPQSSNSTSSNEFAALLENAMYEIDEENGDEDNNDDDVEEEIGKEVENEFGLDEFREHSTDAEILSAEELDMSRHVESTSDLNFPSDENLNVNQIDDLTLGKTTVNVQNENEDFRFVKEKRKRSTNDFNDDISVQRLTSIYTRKNDTLKISKSKTSCPPHPGFAWGLCIACGKKKEEDEKPTMDGISLKYMPASLELSIEETEKLRLREIKELMNEKKLLLVLDLDHTLLNSARSVEIDSNEIDHLNHLCKLTKEKEFAMDSNSLDSNPMLYWNEQMLMWTKLRPGVRSFLTTLSSMFRLVVYTNGERFYAKAMAKLLDPHGVLFEDRIISHGDSTNKGTKNLDIVLGLDWAVLILDDSEAVWPQHRDNLIIIERYHFFKSSKTQFKSHGSSFAEMKKDECFEKGTLLNLIHVFKNIHSQFFSHVDLSDSESKSNMYTLTKKYDRDVRKVIQTEQKKILKGCRILFSRIFPNNTISSSQNHPLWRMAEAMGAVCFKDVHASVTHLVTVDMGTEKSRWAKSQSLFVVNPSWLEASFFLWKRQNESLFPVQPPKSMEVKETEAKKEKDH